MTADYFASEDLTQDTFLAAYGHLKDFDGRHEKAWLCRIATNKCMDYLQSAGRRSIPTDDVGMDESGSYEQTPESILLEEEVRRTLLRLQWKFLRLSERGITGGIDRTSRGSGDAACSRTS